MSTESNPPDGFREALSDLAGELGTLVPRLVERSRDQLAVVAKVVEQLPCLGALSTLGARIGNGDGSHAPDLRLVPGGAEDETDESNGDVEPAVVEAAPATKRPAAKRPATKKAPARKAPAKKAPAKKVSATKAGATKAPAKKAPPAKAPAPTADPAAPAALAIPDYDELAASQVIPRLDSMSADELEAVRVHEAAHRQRRTILSRVAQLQTS